MGQLRLAVRKGLVPDQLGDIAVLAAYDAILADTGHRRTSHTNAAVMNSIARIPGMAALIGLSSLLS
jgi:hypothetical protein